MLLTVAACRNNQSDYVMNSIANEPENDADTIALPSLIDNGTKLVYQFGHMTPDKGLKLYYDTMPYPAKGLTIDESVRRQLSPR